MTKRPANHLVIVGILTAISALPQPAIAKSRKPKIVRDVQRTVDHGRKEAERVAEAAREAARRVEEKARDDERRAAEVVEAQRRRVEAAAKEAEEKANEARKLADAKRLADELAENLRKADEVKQAEAALEQAKEAADKAKRALIVESKRLEEDSQRRVEMLKKAIEVEAGNGIKLENWKRWLSNPEETFRHVLVRGENGIRIESDRLTEYLKDQWWYRNIQDSLLEQLMEKPSFIICGKDFPGPAIIYVNGMLVPCAEAIEAGEAIAVHLQRRVHLLHNPTSIEAPYQSGLEAKGWGTDDLSEAVYDRMFPALLLSRLSEIDQVALSALSKNGERLQANPTTRQLAYALYHSDEPVSLITHSQGCIQARNAFFTLGILGKETKACSNVAWVAAGIPLNDNEIWAKPKRLEILQYHDDPIAKLGGLRGGGLQYNGADHSFVEEFLPQIQQDHLWAH